MDGKPIQSSKEDPRRSPAPENLAPDEDQTEQVCTSSEPESDDDSDIESHSEASIQSTRSYSSLTLQHTHENNRRYADDTYFMPNDEPELTRLNIPPPPPSPTPRILDIGTGPGDWAIEMSAAHPSATIVASDLTIFDSGVGHLALPNVDFQLADARTEWTYHEPFDLIHLRGLSGAFQDWGATYAQAFAHLRPGGYIEVADADPAGDTIAFSPQYASEAGSGLGSASETPALQTYAAALRAAASAANYPRSLAHLNTDALVAAGFVDVRVLERTIPIGLWPDDMAEKSLGKMALIALLEGLEAYALRPLTAHGGYGVEEARDLCDAVRGELLAVRGLTARVRIVTARRPITFAQKRVDLLARAMERAKFLQEGVAVGDGERSGEEDRERG
ncbi:uncharacterized protein N7482_004755 [Penicillium canariense]|uniref:Methyltransferase domain-containing protein n=1 Tax=Penicillium canariense TaxID=189055 RepID=A0A9W9I767_9EURO|nr:uncharacterized protein N7482_004755 [Penicillium canariense]KAJ5169161.1 hypothetical protein N7482_004755 [Penicillium canariense]